MTAAIHDNELIVDLFAGGGGASQGIFQALGRHPDIAINHDETAIAVHKRNHPDTEHLCASVWVVKPEVVCAGRPVGLLWASPDCFPPGTLVTTKNGQLPIEQVLPGTLVLTHKGRWRRVVAKVGRTADTVEVRGHGHYGLITTPGHLFYSKRIVTRYPHTRKENGCRTGPKRTLVENPYWPPAKDMAGKLWATPWSFPDAAIPICQAVEFSEDFFYLFGRWLGDGSLNKGDVEICCGAHEVDDLKLGLEVRPLRNGGGQPIQYRLVDHNTSMLFVWGCADLTRWLASNAGVSCETKQLPIWCLSMQRNWRDALLRGYVDADGHRANRTETKSVSKALAIGIKLLAASLGHSPSLYLAAGTQGQIEGRTFVGQDIYRVVWTPDNEKETSFTDRLHVFTAVKEIKPAGVQLVISLQVDEDESFIADGIVVHNCRHFSRAAGGRPKWKSVRSLPGVVLTWAKRARPRVIVVENVREMIGWGPLLDDGTPCPDRIGRSFNQWVGRLRGMGYAVQWKQLVAADFGAPTIRTRLFVQARCDGLPIVWPTMTHSRRPSLFEQPWRTAAECIDWSIPCPSIFTRKRPLASATLRRVAQGIEKYVLGRSEPYIVRIGHWSHKSGKGFGFRGQGLDEALTTTTPIRDKALVTFVTPLTHHGENRGNPVTDPLATITAAHRGEMAIVAAHVNIMHGTSIGSTAEAPLGTVTAGGGHHAIVSAVLAGCGGRAGQSPPRPMDAPLGTLTTKADSVLVATFLAQHNLGAIGRRAIEPVSTITTRGTQQGLVEAALSADDEVGAARVAAFLIQYYSHGGQWGELHHPLGAITTKGRFALVMVDGVATPIVDIGMRMLAPHELAAAQGFPPAYDLTDAGRLTKTATIRLIGNSVSPPPAEAVIRAAFGVAPAIREEAAA